jgi:hypothetical protein
MNTSAMLLGNDRRMFVVEFLQKSSGYADLRDVVEYIAEREGKTDRKHRKSIYVSLIQTHLPKMEREGVITYRAGTVRLIKVPENVSVYLEIVRENDIRWSTFYILLSLSSAIISYAITNWHGVFISMVFLSLSIIHRSKEHLLLKNGE